MTAPSTSSACSYCHVLGRDLEDGKTLRQCSLYQVYTYCSHACQNADWKLHSKCAALAAKSRRDEEQYMAYPGSANSIAALIAFQERFEFLLIQILAIPYFLRFITLTDTKPLIFHIHFDYKPNNDQPFELVWAKEVCKEDLVDFNSIRGGLPAGRQAAVDWDRLAADDARTPFETEPDARWPSLPSGTPVQPTPTGAL